MRPPMMEVATNPSPTAPGRSGRWALRDVLLLSIGVTLLAAVLALAPARAADVRWSLVFVYMRWAFVFLLLLVPVAHRLAARRGRPLNLPWALRTPATALALTCEGIVYDIASARLG